MLNQKSRQRVQYSSYGENVQNVFQVKIELWLVKCCFYFWVINLCRDFKNHNPHVNCPFQVLIIITLSLFYTKAMDLLCQTIAHFEIIGNSGSQLITQIKHTCNDFNVSNLMSRKLRKSKNRQPNGPKPILKSGLLVQKRFMYIYIYICHRCVLVVACLLQLKLFSSNLCSFHPCSLCCVSLVSFWKMTTMNLKHIPSPRNQLLQNWKYSYWRIESRENLSSIKVISKGILRVISCSEKIVVKDNFNGLCRCVNRPIF